MCLVNSNQKFPKEILKKYKQENAEPVVDNLVSSKKKKVVRADVLSARLHKKDKSDLIKRSFIRHNPDKLAKALMSIL